MTKQELIKKISDFTDWSYQHSDDHRAYRAGKKQAEVLSSFGVNVDDLKEASLDTTFLFSVHDFCVDYKRNVLINDVLYKIEIFYFDGKFTFFARDKNNLFVCAPRKVFDKYLEENLDLRDYENKVLKIIWDSLRG